MSFKVACPSCEAPVLIKNPKLVGTKVECPKCKYRFKVEEPAADPAATDKKPDKGAKGKKKEKKEKKEKKAGGKKKLVPILIGVVALAVLIGVGYAVVGGGDKKKIDPFAQSRKPGGGGEETPPDDPEKKKEGKGKPVTPGTPASDKVTTNLLPGQAVAVYRLNVDQLRGSPIYGSLIDPQVVATFQGTLGFAPDEVETYVHCFAGDGRDPFGVIKLKAPVPPADRRARMPLAPDPKAVKGRDLYAFRAAPLLKAVAQALSMRALFGDLYATLPMAPTTPPKDKPFGVCVYDTQHVLVGDYALLERFLGELGANGYPPFKSELNAAAVPPTPAAPPAPDAPPKDPKAPPKAPVKPPAPGERAFTAVDAYRTLEVPLKRALDDLEANRPAPAPLVVYAEKFDARQYDPKLMKKNYQLLAAALDKVATPLRYLGASVTAFGPRQLVADLRLTFDPDGTARDIAKEQLSPGLLAAVEVLKLVLGVPVEFRDATQPGGLLPGTVPPGTDESPTGTGTQPPMIDPVTGRPIPRAASHVDLSMRDNQLLVAVDLTWPESVYRTTVDPRLSGFANQVKGMMAVVSSGTTWRTLAAAGARAGAKGFPRGTTDQLRTDSSRFSLPHPPVQRVSLFADLLPYMGHDGLARRINPARPWYALERAKPDEATPDQPGRVLVDNLAPAGEWVPELLVPYYPQTAWRATSKYAPDHTLGATNYVAMSGTGLDSARYDPNDPEQKKKVGMTGYGWGSKAEEVTDGLANTIYLIQTPPGPQQPWIAGGGATVRGFDEADPMAGYKYTHPGGKEGTYALMGDGSVRFLPANIDKKVLLGLGTRAGGEALADVDTAAPKVEPPKPAAPVTTAPPPPEKK